MPLSNYEQLWGRTIPDLRVTMGGNAINPWTLALMSMRQLKGDSNWRPGAGDTEFENVAEDANAYLSGARGEALPSSIRQAKQTAQEKAASAQVQADIQRALGSDASGTEGNSANAGPGSIVGYSGPHAGLFGSVLSLGLPGLPGALFGAGKLALGAAKGPTGLNTALQDAFPLSQVTPQNTLNPVSNFPTNMLANPTFTENIMSFLGIPTQVNQAVMSQNLNAFSEALNSPENPNPELSIPSVISQAARAAQVPSVNAFSTQQGHPAFGFQGFNPPAQNPRAEELGDSGGTSGASTGSTGAGGAGAGTGPTGGASSTGPAEGNVSGPGASGPGASTGFDDGGMGGQGSATGGVGAGTGAAGSGTAGTAGAGGNGGGPSGGGESYRGGLTKGKRTQKTSTKVHGQEFVVNASATEQFRPLLEALNKMVKPSYEHDLMVDALTKLTNKPSSSSNRFGESFDSLLRRASHTVKGD